MGVIYGPIPSGTRILDLGIDVSQHVLLPGASYVQCPPLPGSHIPGAVAITYRL